MVLHHLKAGGISKLTQRLIEGPSLFQVSEKAFYLRTSRLFPISIFTFLLSASSASILESFQNQEIDKLLGNDFHGVDQEVRTFLMRFVEEDIRFKQCELKKADRIFLARELSQDLSRKKVLVAVVER
jgi:hypothetical protein